MSAQKEKNIQKAIFTGMQKSHNGNIRDKEQETKLTKLI